MVSIFPIIQEGDLATFQTWVSNRGFESSEFDRECRQRSPKIGSWQTTCLQIAAQSRQINIFRYIVAMPDVGPNALGVHNATPLILCAQYRFPDGLAFLLKEYPNTIQVNAQDTLNDLTALNHAAQNSDRECLTALSQVAGIDPNIPDCAGNTALCNAAGESSVECLKIVCGIPNVDFDWCNNDGYEAETIARDNGFVECADLLAEIRSQNA